MRENQLTAEDGYRALREHVVERARSARARYGPAIDASAIARMLADPEVVRFPTRLVFDSAPLLPGEFAHALALGERPSDGFALVVHPSLELDAGELPLAVAYHLVSINYLDVVTAHEAELFGATLLGLTLDEYYARLCSLADRLAAPDCGSSPAAAAASACACGRGGGGSCGKES